MSWKEDHIFELQHDIRLESRNIPSGSLIIGALGIALAGYESVLADSAYIAPQVPTEAPVLSNHTELEQSSEWSMEHKALLVEYAKFKWQRMIEQKSGVWTAQEMDEAYRLLGNDTYWYALADKVTVQQPTPSEKEMLAVRAKIRGEHVPAHVAPEENMNTQAIIFIALGAMVTAAILTVVLARPKGSKPKDQA